MKEIFNLKGSMRDNLVFSGIPKQADEDPEAMAKEFLQSHIKRPRLSRASPSTVYTL